MGNSSSSISKTFHTGNHHKKDKKRPHSVLGISDDIDRVCGSCVTSSVPKGVPLFCGLKHRSDKSSDNHRPNGHGHGYPINAQRRGLQLPPIPRSHSFHQVLRPTENGAILAQKGTIRGFEHNLNHLTSSNKKQVMATTIAEELSAILRSRRCKSETDLSPETTSDDCPSSLTGDGSGQPNSMTNSDNSSRPSATGSAQQDFARKNGASNGVAARIQRAKYKAPPPPPSPTPQSPTPAEVTIEKDNNKNIRKCDTKIGNEIHNEKPVLSSVPKTTSNLIRKLSEKSYKTGSSYEVNDSDLNNCQNAALKKFNLEIDSKNLPFIPRLKMSNVDAANDLNGANICRNIVFDSKVLSNTTKVIDRFSDSTDKKTKIRRTASNRDTTTVSTGSNIQFDTDPNGNTFENKLANIIKQKIPTINRQSPDGANSNHCNLPYAFDDNFILRRCTPTAGLNEHHRGIIENLNKNKTKQIESPLKTKRSVLPWYADQHGNRYVTTQTPEDVSPFTRKSNFLDRHDIPLSPIDLPPPLPFSTDNDTTYEVIPPQISLSSPSSANCKVLSYRTNVSDSANYSDEDEEEEEIKVILRPQLPPPPYKKGFLNSLLQEDNHRVIVGDDLFDCQPTAQHSRTRGTRNTCWTPLHDLSSSEDDDGINSDHEQLTDEDSHLQCNRDTRDIRTRNNCATRFTLQNQLRTLIQNGNKMRQRHYFP